MASIEKRGDGWRVRWRDQLGQAHTRQAPTLRAAKELQRQVEEAAALGRSWSPPDAVRAPALADVLTAYLRDCARRVAPRTLESRRSTCAVFLAWLVDRERTEALPVSLLSRSLLADWDADQLARELSPNTRATRLDVMADAWRWAFDHDTFGPHIPRPKRVEGPRRPVAVTLAPTWSEMDAAVLRARARAQRYVLQRAFVPRLVFLLRSLSWRVSQILRLDWADVDMARETIRLRPALGKSPGERAGREVPMPPVVREELAGWGKREGLVIGREVSVSYAGWAVKACWREARVDGEPVRPDLYTGRPDHAFRKGWVTELRRAGGDPDAIEYYVGHTTGIRGVYTDPDALPMRALVALIPAVGSRVRQVSVPEVAALDGARSRRSRA